MGWFVVLLIALALALAGVSIRRWATRRLDPTLADVRAAAAEARGVPLRALLQADERVGWLTPGHAHVLIAGEAVSSVVALAAEAPVLVMTASAGPFVDGVDVPSGRVLVSEQPAVSWSVGAAARELTAGNGVVVLDLGESDPGDLVEQSVRAASRRGLAVLLVASGPHVDRLVAAMAQAGETGRVRREE
ncbi:MAG: hypothetical protein GY913_20095 [Proteobacteria bacterium]|nr:hypothetical protein [Pseudomonadota bacterium]MCP4919208.1 hypothetical protein [Pseudomonadota bacterium]